MWEQLLGLFNFNQPNQQQPQRKIESLFNITSPAAQPLPSSSTQTTAPEVNQSQGSSDEKTKFYGQEAVTKALEYYPNLTKGQIDLIAWEGFSTKPYKDSKKYITTGVGQTGEFMNMPYTDVYKIFEDRVRKAIPRYNTFSDNLKSALVIGKYRGDLGDDTISLINKGKFKEASREFLNHTEYRKYANAVAKAKKEGKDPTKIPNYQIYDRMNWVSNIIGKGN
jgi:hypothetical protein